ncbi:hypothetical protein AGMMS50293_20830 [Spirochaetia bacterium]|nr:hypothetical protein AGMMS50293_20830 [Spirochaetia bacterium]
MGKTRKTKYFGDVELTIDDFYCNAELRAELNRQEIEMGTWSCKNMENLERELPFFWEVVDKYVEINERAKKAIVEYYDSEKEGPLGCLAPIFERKRGR